MRKKHLFFDMDGTLTFTRSKITPHMEALIAALLPTHTVAVISGSTNDQMEFQINGLPIIKMGQNGNHVIDSVDGELWFDTLTATEKAEVFGHIAALRPLLNYDVPDPDDLIEDRGSQVSFSIYGHHADPGAKKAFDGDFKRRTALLAAFPFVSGTVDVRMGGSTTFDYFKKGHHKGYNIARLLAHKGWNPDECLFFGDALFSGGNDESVIGVIETIAVADEEDCYEKLKSMNKALQ